MLCFCIANLKEAFGHAREVQHPESTLSPLLERAPSPGRRGLEMGLLEKGLLVEGLLGKGLQDEENYDVQAANV